MKNRWIGGFLLVMVLAMAGCAPPQQGAGASSEPSEAAPASAEPMASEQPAQTEDDGGGQYDY